MSVVPERESLKHAVGLQLMKWLGIGDHRGAAYVARVSGASAAHSSSSAVISVSKRQWGLLQREVDQLNKDIADLKQERERIAARERRLQTLIARQLSERLEFNTNVAVNALRIISERNAAQLHVSAETLFELSKMARPFAAVPDAEFYRQKVAAHLKSDEEWTQFRDNALTLICVNDSPQANPDSVQVGTSAIEFSNA